jgi:hypothetical protein
MALARITSLLLLGILVALGCTAQQVRNQPLQFTVQQTTSNFILQADTQNVGSAALRLYFGISDGKMKTEPVHLSLTDANGKVTILTAKHYITTDPNFRNEKRDLRSVTLRPGENYSFRIDLRNYVDEMGLPLASGHYTLRATFSCDSAFLAPSMSSCTGSVNAPPLPVTIPNESTE